jgi:ATP-dependent DNA helicase RecG
MPREQYELKLMERMHATRRWENEPVEKSVTIGDLDDEEIKRTVENSKRIGRLALISKATLILS